MTLLDEYITAIVANWSLEKEADILPTNLHPEKKPDPRQWNRAILKALAEVSRTVSAQDAHSELAKLIKKRKAQNRTKNGRKNYVTDTDTNRLVKHFEIEYSNSPHQRNIAPLVTPADDEYREYPEILEADQWRQKQWREFDAQGKGKGPAFNRRGEVSSPIARPPQPPARGDKPKGRKRRSDEYEDDYSADDMDELSRDPLGRRTPAPKRARPSAHYSLPAREIDDTGFVSELGPLDANAVQFVADTPDSPPHFSLPTQPGVFPHWISRWTALSQQPQQSSVEGRPLEKERSQSRE